MSENAGKLVRDVGSVHVDMSFAGIVVNNSKAHMDVANDAAVFEMNYYPDPISVGRPYEFELRIAMDVRLGFDGLHYLAHEQTFNFKGGDYTQHALTADAKHRFKCHDAVGTFRSLSDSEYAERLARTSRVRVPFLKMDGSVVRFPWGCTKVTPYFDEFRVRDWDPGISRVR